MSNQQQQGNFTEIVQDIIEVFGMKYKPREQEPSMYALLTWQVPDDGQQFLKKAHEVGQAQNTGYQQLKARIAKTNDPYVSEANDNYVKYQFDKQTNTLIPQYDPKILEQLSHQRGQQGLKQKSPQVITDKQVKSEQFLQNSKYFDAQKNNLSVYQNEHTYKNVKNPEQLVEELAHNVAERGKKVNYSPAKQYLYYEEQPDVQQQDNPENQKENQEKDEEEQVAHTTPDIKNAKSKLFAQKKKATKLDPIHEKERLDRRKKRIYDMERTTRWLPNSAFQTYFGKPAFENYGMGNVQPLAGGFVYGNYMLSHNVNPHKGKQQPEYVQSFNNALEFAQKQPETRPEPPRKCKDEYRESQQQVENLKSRNPLHPHKNQRTNLKLIKPDLVNSLRFASEENSPTNVSSNQQKKQKKQAAKSAQKENQETLKGDEQTTAVTKLNQKQVSFQNQNQDQTLQPQTTQPTRKQNTKQQQSKQQQDQNQQEQQENQDDVCPERQFLQEIKAKKAKAQRIALKPTEVLPVAQKQALQQNRALENQSSQITDNNIDEMNPPEGYLQSLQVFEIDPKSYKNIPPQWLKRIPFAGKKYNWERPYSAFE